MTAGLRYTSAREVAPKVQAHFASVRAQATGDGAGPSMSPSAADELRDIAAVVDTAFWASLRREENYLPRISLALLPPAQAGSPLLFDRPLPLDPISIVRVAPAVERRGIHLGVWRDADNVLRVAERHC